MYSPIFKSASIAFVVAAATIWMADLASAQTESAQTVSAQISARQAYVGQPIVLQIRIQNASEYEPPELPTVPGCDVKSGGTPSQSSQITIFNGRRSESRSVTMQYLFTPRRAGKFEIPALTLEVDGRKRTTNPITFEATKSETGDLMFVEIIGSKEKVYVGQSLDLTLKIWLKPFQDPEQRIKLNEGHMWQVLAQNSTWGSFAEAFQAMKGNNQRPGGQKTFREDDQGNRQEYFVYEIESTIYPQRPGKIDTDDVQIVVNYPVKLGRSRDPFDSLFEELNRGFGNSGFGRGRLRVSESRPISATAVADSTEVIPIPTAGRPANYRGAVGKYRIVTETETRTVDAGDPLLLKIGIVGDGPMELVQAPPLAEIKAVADDFKAEDRQLAGYVQEDTKVFAANLRARRAGVTEIPPVPFTFFDPEKESFETVYSDAIPITVNATETLSLDSIVSNSSGRSQNSGSDPTGEGANSATGLNPVLVPSLDIETSDQALVSQQPSADQKIWLYLVFGLPLIWLAIVSTRFVKRFLSPSNFQSAASRCQSKIEAGEKNSDLIDALVSLIGSKLKLKNESAPKSNQQAIGALRSNGMSETANGLESFFDQLGQHTVNTKEIQSFESRQNEARQWATRINDSIDGKQEIRRKGSRRTTSAPSVNLNRLSIWMLALAGALIMNAQTVMAQSSVRWTNQQQASIFDEGNQSYLRGQKLAATDQAESREAFELAVQKYRSLVNAGIRNEKLFLNLGNACLRSGQLGHAIANFHRALKLAPGNTQAETNLEFAVNKVSQERESATQPDAADQSDRAIVSRVVSWTVNAIGTSNLQWVAVIASVLFWGLLIVRAVGVRFPVWRWVAIPMIGLIGAGAILIASTFLIADRSTTGIMVVQSVELRTGDGLEFEVCHQLESVEGQSVEVMAERGMWVQIKTGVEQTGWLPSDQLAIIN